jgi:phosphonate transport system substrate-binding protein
VRAWVISTLAVALLAAAPGGRGAGAGAEGKAYAFGVVPQGPPERMRAQWLPLVERLAAEAGLPLELQLYAKIEDFQDALAAGAVDLAFANPVQTIRAHRAAGYRPLVRDEGKLRGVFFVASGSPFSSVEALAGREVAFVGPWTFCSVSLRAHVRELGIVSKFVGTSANAYKNVLLGLTDAGGVLDSTLADAPPEVRAKLRVIYETPPMAPHAVIVHPRVPREAAARLVEALRALAREGRPSTDASHLLAAVHLSSPVEAVYARDYAPLEFLLDGDGATTRRKGQ